MATIKYTVKENQQVGTHSFYASAKSYSTLTFDDLANEVVEGVGIEPALVKTMLERFMKVAKRNVLRGHRVNFGDLLTIYPSISASVKDVVDSEGNVITPATADMVTAVGAKSRIGATISKAVNAEFAANVQWTKVDDTTADGSTTDEELPDDSEGEGGGGDGGDDGYMEL